MKKKLLFFIIPIAAAIFIFNITSENKIKSTHALRIEVIGLVQASAGEVFCDATNPNVCTIGQGVGTGRLVTSM
jgi:hypothetical protein